MLVAAYSVSLGILLLLFQALKNLLAVARPTVGHDVLDAVLAHLLPLLGLGQDLDQGISNLLAAVGVHQEAVVQGGHDVHRAPILGGNSWHTMGSSLMQTYTQPCSAPHDHRTRHLQVGIAAVENCRQ